MPCNTSVEAAPQRGALRPWCNRLTHSTSSPGTPLVERNSLSFLAGVLTASPGLVFFSYAKIARMIFSTSSEIAQTAARLVVEEGLDWGAAKRRALKQLGLPARTALPDNDVLEVAVREYIELFCADTQPQELRALRELALVWMQRLQDFRPHLAGAVWRGTATRRSDIYIQLFCDDPKSAEIALLDNNVRFEARQVPGFKGELVDALSIHSLCQPLGETVGVHLLVHDFDDLRGARKPDAQGRRMRGDLAALRA